jgi:hypothetical protein
VTIKQLRKRIERLALPRDAVCPDLPLAAQWDDSTAHRFYELCDKTQPLTDVECSERAHLAACHDAWSRLYFPEEVERERIEREVYGWTEADDARYWELLNRDWRNIQALTLEERSELEILEKKRPPRDASFAKAWD